MSLEGGRPGRRSSDAYRRIYEAVRRIPAGRVATYGQVAAVAGLPGHARQVGYALNALSGDDHQVPWQRVINARGMVSPRSEEGPEHLQRLLLEEEGIEFGAGGRISLARYRWDPDAEEGDLSEGRDGEE